MSKPLRVALLGGGKMALEHAKAIRRCPHSQLVAVADVRIPPAELRASFGEGVDYFSDPLDLLASIKPDVVHVVTPPGTHAALAQASLEAGANIYVEKPFALKSTDAEIVLDLADARGLRVCAAHQILFQNAARSYRAELASLGDVVHIESFFSFRPVRRRAEVGGVSAAVEQLLDILPHPVYLILDAMQAASGVSAEMVSFEATLEGEVRGIIRCGSALGCLVVSLRARPVESWLRIMGSNGMVEAEFVLGNVIRHPGPGASAPSIVIKPFSRAWQTTWGSLIALMKLLFRRGHGYPGLAELVEKFHQSILRQADSPVSRTEILSTVRLCEVIAARLRQAADAADRSAAIAIQALEARLPAMNDRGVVLLTGGTGILGRVTAETLRSQGWRVRVPCRRHIPTGERVAGVEYLSCDLAVQVPDEIMKNVEVVMHLAAETAGSKAEHERNTINVTRNVLEAMTRMGVRRLVNVSSVAVLKPSRAGKRLDESSPVDYGNLQRGPYVWAKAEAERLIAESAKSARIEARTVRLGPLIEYDGFVAPGRLGREIARLYVAMGRPSNSLSVCRVTTATRYLGLTLANFDRAPPVCNLIEQPAPTRGELAQRLRRARPDLRLVWIPFWLLRPASVAFAVLSKIVRPRAPALDLYSAFKSESYDDSISRSLETAR